MAALHSRNIYTDTYTRGGVTSRNNGKKYIWDVRSKVACAADHFITDYNNTCNVLGGRIVVVVVVVVIIIAPMICWTEKLSIFEPSPVS